MARVEVPVRTGLRFHGRREGRAPALHELGRAETVNIEFERRTMVWHEIPTIPPDPPFPEMKYGPTVTTVYSSDADEQDARTAIARFISALVWEFDYLIDTRRFNTSGEIDPFHRPVHVEMNAFPGVMILPAPERVEVTPDDRLRLALGVLREAVNASTPYLAYFAFFNVIDTAFDGSKTKVDAFINVESKGVAGLEKYVRQLISDPAAWKLPTGDVAEYVRTYGRDAIAHVVRMSPKLPEIDPDVPRVRDRLIAEAWWLRSLARRAIETRWPNPVRVHPRL